jgi:hypothetical protein
MIPQISSFLFCSFLLGSQALAGSTISFPNARTLALMDNLVLKQIDLHDATMEEVVETFTRETKVADPKGRGLSFTLKPSPLPPSRITLTLRHVSLREALRALYGRSGFAYFAARSGIVLEHSGFGDGLYQRVFDCPRDFWTPRSGPTSKTAEDVTRQLSAKGIELGTGRVDYNFDREVLTVVGVFQLISDVEALLFRTYGSKTEGKPPLP